VTLWALAAVGGWALAGVCVALVLGPVLRWRRGQVCGEQVGVDELLGAGGGE
jgi:hypothetical protein